MISPHAIINQLDQIFFQDSDSKKKIASFINEKCKDETKWFIVSDYCIGDKNKANDCMSFTILPYFASIEEMIKMVDQYIPTDLKNIKNVKANSLYFLKEFPFLFTITFLIKGKKFLFYDENKERKTVIREAMDSNPDWFKEQHCEILSNLTKNLKKNNFNCGLFENLYLTTILVSYISFLLVKISKNKPKNIAWFPDRDPMNDFCKGLLPLIHNSNFQGLLEINKIGNNDIILGLGTSDKKDQPLWYDGIIKIPDYLCGALSSCDIEKMTVEKYKHLQLIRDVISDNQNLSVIQFNFDKNGSNCAELKFSKILQNKKVL